MKLPDALPISHPRDLADRPARRTALEERAGIWAIFNGSPFTDLSHINMIVVFVPNGARKLFAAISESCMSLKY